MGDDTPVPQSAASLLLAERNPCAAFAARPGADPLTGAFARRQFVAPWRGSEPVAPDDVEAVLQLVFRTPRAEPAIAYVHVPYCQNHCLFCGFFQNTWRPEVSAAFVDDVIAEMERNADTPLIASAPVDAVYIGGGGRRFKSCRSDHYFKRQADVTAGCVARRFRTASQPICCVPRMIGPRSGNDKSQLVN